MLVRVRFEFNYSTDGSACYDIVIPAEELPENEDWLHLFYEHVDPQIAELAYKISWLNLQFM